MRRLSLDDPAASNPRSEILDGIEGPQLAWGNLRPQHRDQIAAILATSELFRPNEIEVALEVFDGHCEAPLGDYRALGCFNGGAADGTLAGFAAYGPTPCTLGTWDLYWIAVRPGLQGRGIGTQLLRRVELAMIAGGARLCIVETSSRSDYASTRRFYVANGYRETARVQDFYADGDDQVVYTKRFAIGIASSDDGGGGGT